MKQKIFSGLAPCLRQSMMANHESYRNCLLVPINEIQIIFVLLSSLEWNGTSEMKVQSYSIVSRFGQ